MSIGEPGRTHLPRPSRLYAGALAILFLLALSATPVQATASKPSPWIELGGGSHRNFLWSIKAKSGEGPTGEGPLGTQRPCLLVAASWQTGQLEYHRSKYRQCAPASPLRRSGPPLIASAMQPSTEAAVQMSAVGMIFAPAARRVRVTLDGSRTKTIRLHTFDRVDAGAPGLGHFRYAAFDIHGAWCAERLVSLSGGGRMLWDSSVDDYRCGAGGPPKFAGR
jgi:hypothetical protein